MEDKETDRKTISLAEAWQEVQQFLPSYDFSLTWHGGEWTARLIRWTPPPKHYAAMNAEAPTAIRAVILQVRLDGG